MVTGVASISITMSRKSGFLGVPDSLQELLHELLERLLLEQLLQQQVLARLAPP